MRQRVDLTMAAAEEEMGAGGVVDGGAAEAVGCVEGAAVCAMATVAAENSRRVVKCPTIPYTSEGYPQN